MFKRLLLYLIFLFNCFFAVSQKSDGTKVDSIVFWIEKSKDPSLSVVEKSVFAKEAKKLSAEINNDSLYNQALKQIAINYYSQEKNLFKNASKEYLAHSLKIKDSQAIANANRLLADFYRLSSISDSAYFYYYNAEKIYKALGDSLSLSRTLLRIAIVQKNEKDFIGSEITSIEGISIVEPLGDLGILSFFYNNLGIIYNELGQYDQAIAYHKKSIDFKKKFKQRDKALEESSYNNLAVVYKNAKEYEKALEYFELILKDTDLKKNDPSFYAMVLDNYAHTKFLSKKNEDVPKLYFEALKVCDSIKDQYNAIALNIHVSEYYNSIQKLDSARYYAHLARDIAEEFHNDDYLKALLNLSKIEEDSLSVNYYKEYIALNDSLIDNERKIRNKFLRIRYETKAIEKRNEQISKERLYLLILSIGLLITFFLTYIVISQRAKNKELKLNQVQQQANEEIYNLMLTQQEKVNEGRAQEKRRISEELHDGILGRLFGTRLSLDSLNSSSSEEAARSRAQYIDELKSIEQEIRKISHDLNTDFVAGSEFFEMIENLVENQTQAYKLSYDLKKDGNIDWDMVSNKTKINLYRIVQESLQNIYKHANAKHVYIRFKLENGYINLEIKDDGSGFDVDKAKKGIGIKNIRSRVKEVDGTVKIESEKQLGTTIKVKVPQ